MGRSVNVYDPILTIAGGQLPLSGATPWRSNSDGVGSAAGTGQQVSGWHIDELRLYFTPSAWDGVTQAELLVETNSMQDGSGRWGVIDPSMLDGAVSGHYVDILGDGRVVIKNALAAAATLCIHVRLPGPRRVRVSLRKVNDGESAAAFACTMAMELIQNGLHS